MTTVAEYAGPVLTMPGAPPAFHLMAKPTGAICNLDCEYCFFLSKELLYPGSRFRMADELQRTYIRQLLEAHQRVPEVVIAWQGGEPTIMGLDFFRRSIELQQQYARPGQHILNTLQTNGTLLDDDWGAFLKEHEFLVGISIDGPREIHDTYRVSKGGKPTFDRVIRGLDVLKHHGVDWNVLTTLYTQTGELVSHRSIGAEQYGAFMIDVFEEWVRRDIGRVYVQMFDTALANFYGEPPGMCVHAETCGLQLALEHNGDLYRCDHFVEPDYLLGNITETPMQQLITSPKQTRFGRDKRDLLTEYCLDCDVRFACNGGCPKDRFATSPYGESPQHYLCPSYKAFFHHVDRPMRAMAALLAAGRAPAELIAVYETEDAHRGRNEPCTCGSGQKWKHCHGSTQS